ncbi:carboxymuconolactone decarboxylase family protein [Brevibacillus ruminantium]|uniref:Carboxymuconolactone decarboxylase family protein n=1 Tax=Brevibacillus ruminantium TaxID=2950604 RepID=A0ABY4WB00_9BACL|nr:carboxymuconolactone decarboxylase family protein [Brevibacillus ruminantium]USG64356.1 carboxymuconolactone decarboxylase family protein [Brevibacillus ruminantium]
MKPYYSPANLQRIPDLMKMSPEAAKAYFHFERQVYEKANVLPQKTKELLALTVAHVTGCPYCIDVHVKKFKALGGSMEEIVEALLVAASTRSGAILSHGLNALNSYEEAAESPDERKTDDEPKCFC